MIVHQVPLLAGVHGQVQLFRIAFPHDLHFHADLLPSDLTDSLGNAGQILRGGGIVKSPHFQGNGLPIIRRGRSPGGFRLGTGGRSAFAAGTGTAAASGSGQGDGACQDNRAHLS